MSTLSSSPSPTSSTESPGPLETRHVGGLDLCVWRLGLGSPAYPSNRTKCCLSEGQEVKKLILLAIAAAGVGVLVKNKSEQLKAGANKVTSDPRVQSALATASEKAAPLKEKAAPYAEAVKEKAGPYAATVKEKAGPYAEQAKEKVSAAAGVASDKLHRNGSVPESTPESAAAPAADGFVSEAPAAPESTTGSSSTSEYGGYPPAPPAPSAPQAGVTGDPLTDPIDPADPYATEVPPPPAPPADTDQTSYDDLGGGDTAVKPTPEGTPEYAPEPVDPAEEKKTDNWFRG
ncbi:PE-PGRS family protein [Nocardioidaceae bacterium Broad-1]|nr:PE-PGRS family protein [Nocardioidaceae bacterium Broad-1]